MIGRFLVAYSLALVHEACHYMVGKKMNLPIEGFTLRPWGSALLLPPIRQPWKEFVVSSAGPLFHFFLIPFSLKNEFFFFINCAMLFINILPALPLDGGRMLKAVLLMNLPAKKAYQISHKVTSLTIVFFILFSFLETLVTHRIATSTAIPFFLIISYRSVQDEQKIGLMRRLSKKEVAKKWGNAYLVSENAKAIRICSELFLDRINLFFLVGRNGICGMLDEETVLRSLGERGTEITFQKIFANVVEKKREIG